MVLLLAPFLCPFRRQMARKNFRSGQLEVGAAIYCLPLTRLAIFEREKFKRSEIKHCWLDRLFNRDNFL